MDKEEYREALRKLGLTQAQAAELLGKNERTSRRYALGETDVPHAVALVLEQKLRFCRKGKS